jgi:hypothetical protein
MRRGKEGRDEYFDAGPFAAVFGTNIPMARVLDQSLLVGNLEFTRSGLAEGTGLTFKTVQSCLDHLREINWVSATRKIGNAQAYKFNIENHMSEIVKWATNYQLSRQAASN